MNKKPYYRQSAIVFSGLGIMLLTLSVEMILHSNWLHFVVFGLIILLIVFAIASSIVIAKKYK